MSFDHQHLLDPPKARAAYADRTSYVMAELSKLAYMRFEDNDNPEEKENLEKELKKGGFTCLKYFNKENKERGIDTQAMLVGRSNYAVLVFRGTEAKSLSDIKTDINARMVDASEDEEIKIHRGFSNAYKEVHEVIVKEVNKLDKMLYITGHSLGAALATVAALKLPNEKIAACYTFGSPRVGSSNLDKELYKVPIYRVVNKADSVTRVPLMLMGYRHTGDLRYIDSSGNILRSPNQLRLLFRYVWSLLTGPSSLFKDHSIETYSSRLEKWALERRYSKR